MTQKESKIEEEVGRVVEDSKELQEAASSLISRSSREEKELRQRLLSLDASISRLHSSLSSLAFDGRLDPMLTEKVHHEYF